jgi:predicted kinase
MIAVLVNGLPGAGKSTLSRQLARELRLPLFSKDVVKETLADVLGVTPPDERTALEWSAALGKASALALWALLEDSCRGAVLENPWLAHLRPIVAESLRRAKVTEIHEIWCEVPPEVARKRCELRLATRHAIHNDRGDDFGERWAQWVPLAEPLALGHVYRVDTTGPVDVGCLAASLRRHSGRL